MSGCDKKEGSLTGNEDIEVTVGSALPDFLADIELTDVLLDDIVVDYSAVDMNVIGDYVVTYTLPAVDDEEITYDITVHVVAVPAAPEPVILGTKNVTQVIGEERINLMDGVTALDNKYGDLTHLVLITEDVSWSTPGTYDVRYQVGNIDGYSTVAEATVEVKFDDSVLELPSEFIIVEQDGFYGLKTSTGEDLLPLEYDYIRYIGEGVLLLEKNENTFYYNSSVMQFIQYDYYLEGPFIDGLAIVMYESEYMDYEYREYGYNESNYSYMNSAGELIMPFIYSRAYPFVDGLAIVQIGDNYGVIDKSGNEVINIMYEYVDYFVGDSFIIKIEDRYDVFDLDGKFIIELSKDYAIEKENYDESILYLVQIDYKSALIDENLNVVLQTDYNHASSLAPGVFFGFIRNQSGAIYNLENDTMIDGVLDLSRIEEDRLIETLDGWGVYDLASGTVVIDPIYESLELLYGTDNLFIAENEDGMFGVVKSNELEPVFDFEANSIMNNHDELFESGFFMFTDEDGYYGLLNLQGMKSTTNTYLSIKNFSYGWALVQDKDTYLYGYLINDQYDNEHFGIGTTFFNANSFYNGYASVQYLEQSQGWTVLNSEGSFISEQIGSEGYYVPTDLYFEVSNFEEGMARVRTSSFYEASQYAYINETGEEIYSDLSNTDRFYNGYAAVRFTYDNNSWGMIDNEGTVIVPGIYGYVFNELNGMIKVADSQLYGFYNITGELVVPVEYVGTSFYYDDRVILESMKMGIKHYEVADANGTIIFDSGTREISPYQDGLARRYNDAGFATYYNTDGELEIQTYWTTACTFLNGLACFQDDNTELYGLFNTDGDIVVEAQYTEVVIFAKDSDFVYVSEGNTLYVHGLIDLTGKSVLQPNYRLFEDGYDRMIFRSIYGESYEWIFDEGITDIDFYDMNGNLYTKKYDNGWIIYKGNDVIVSNIYDQVKYSPSKNMFVTYLDGKMGLEDIDGTIILEPIFSFLDYYNGDSFIGVELEGNNGIYSLEGEEIISPKYDYINYDQTTNTFIVQNGEIYGLYDSEGTKILEIEYNSLRYIDTEAEIYLK
jgi:hypothetical protein